MQHFVQFFLRSTSYRRLLTLLGTHLWRNRPRFTRKAAGKQGNRRGFWWLHAVGVVAIQTRHPRFPCTPATFSLRMTYGKYRVEVNYHITMATESKSHWPASVLLEDLSTFFDLLDISKDKVEAYVSGCTKNNIKDVGKLRDLASLQYLQETGLS